MSFLDHDPLPWTVDEIGGDRANLYVLNACDLVVAKVVGWPEADMTRQPKETAEFIVRACNSHDELVAACKALVEWATDFEADDERTTSVLNRAVAAIAKAEGGRP